jgi:acetaldehyde dehydrogenase
MTDPRPVKVAIVGSGNIGTDLMIKATRSPVLEVAAVVGIDPDSDGLARARAAGIEAVSDGVAGLIALPGFDKIDVVFDATSAAAHVANAAALTPYGKRLIDLTPAALGPFVIPAVNLDAHRGAENVNMVTCGGQATIPVVAAIAAVVPVAYAEIVASIASKSAGPGTRANIDEFTETTSHAIESVGGAERGKAIIVLNPAEPPLMMRDTVLALVDLSAADAADVERSVADMVAQVAAYVPGYRLKQAVQIAEIPADQPVHTLLRSDSDARPTHQVSVFLEVEGAADYLPAYAGNLDIMTSAAIRYAEAIAADRAAATSPAS